MKGYIADAAELGNIIKTGCNKIFRRKRARGNKVPAYWWSEKVSKKRRICVRARKNMVRANRNLNDTKKMLIQEEYKQSRADLKRRRYYRPS
ncbi:hypothetical protein JTB14_020518 [Gonioctena quinquepunctata]|nr:hypothetical protein JTB14_020518 [Gonioctena quinquepunctata]